MRPSNNQHETVAHLRAMAARYRQLALASWDTDVLKILNEMSRDDDNEAHAVESGEADDAEEADDAVGA